MPDGKLFEAALDSLHAVLAAIPAALILLDPEGRVVGATPAAHTLLGVGLPPGVSLDALLAGRIDLAEAFSRGDDGEVEVAGTGRQLAVRRRSWYLPHAKLGGSLLEFRDITEQRWTLRDRSRRIAELTEAHRTIERQRADLDLLLESVDTGVVVTDPTGTVRMSNSAARDLFGQVPTEGRELALFEADGDTPLEPHPLGEALAGREHRTLGRTASGRSVVLAARPLGEEPRAAVLTAHDMTALVEVQSQLDEFAYVASHDMREPLRMVASFMELLDEEYGEGLDEQARTFVRHAREGALRMQRLVADLLEVSRSEHEAVRWERVEVAPLLQVIVNDTSRLASDSGVAIRLDVPADLVVDADEAQLSQLLQNLISNGIKFRREEAPEGPLVQITATVGLLRAEVAVSDNGIGVAPAYQERIFQMFQRLHPRDAYPGSGIGLAVARRIARRHGSTLEIRSVPGEGSRFWFSLPLWEPGASSRNDEAAP